MKNLVVLLLITLAGSKLLYSQGEEEIGHVLFMGIFGLPSQQDEINISITALPTGEFEGEYPIVWGNYYYDPFRRSLAGACIRKHLFTNWKFKSSSIRLGRVGYCYLRSKSASDWIWTIQNYN